MSRAAKQFLSKSLLFALPFLVYGLIVVVVDPFNYFGTNGVVSTHLKEDVSQKVNYAMWKMLKFRRNPVPNLLLGDSRMMSVDAELVTSISGAPYANMAYGGGSLREAIDTFWFAADRVKLQNVYFGININSYNAGNSKNRVSEVLAALDNPLLYFSNNNLLIAGEKLVKALISGKAPALGVPDMDRESFWRHQLNVITRVYFSEYRYPEEYREELVEVSQYCRRQGIKLNFVLFPNHVDLQNKIEEYNLQGYSDRMRLDLGEMGKVYDFAFPNHLTNNRDNYRDPYHFNKKVMESIVESIWKSPGDIVKIFGQETS